MITPYRQLLFSNFDGKNRNSLYQKESHLQGLYLGSPNAYTKRKGPRKNLEPPRKLELEIRIHKSPYRQLSLTKA